MSVPTRKMKSAQTVGSVYHALDESGGIFGTTQRLFLTHATNPLSAVLICIRPAKNFAHFTHPAEFTLCLLAIFPYL